MPSALGRLISEGLIGALGDGWLGKLIVGGACALAAWFARRPAEKAAMMAVVDQKVSTFLVHMEKELERACKRCDEMADDLAQERARCDRELTAMREEIARHMAKPIAGYVTINPEPVKKGGGDA